MESHSAESAADDHESFTDSDFAALLDEGRDRYEWARRSGASITGDSAPPPIPLGRVKGDPDAIRLALDQAREIQKAHPPPAGRVWHSLEGVEEQLVELGGEEMREFVRRMTSADEPQGEDGAAGRHLVAVVGGMAVTIGAVVAVVTLLP